MSLLVSVIYSNDSYLFTGDIQESGIAQFVKQNKQTYDVIKIPHHGKIENNSKSLLDSTKPKYAVITDDDDKEASKKLCRLLDSAGINYYRTSVKGTVTIIGNGSGKYKIKTSK